MTDYRLEPLLTPRSVTWGALIINILLTMAKVLVGLFAHSQTLIADGLHSASDLVTDVAVLAGLRISSKPADLDHPYGHRRYTTLAAMFVGLVLLGAAAWIAINAVLSIGHPTDVRPELPFWVALASVPLKEFLFWVTRYVGRKENDLSLQANAWHHRTDAFTSIAAAAGLAGVWIGGAKWHMLDALTALVLSAFLLVVSVQIILTAMRELTDRAPNRRLLKRIEEAIAYTEGVRNFHAFRAREIGGRMEMDIHVLVDPNLTVRQGHDIATNVKKTVMETDPTIVEVIVHIEPAEN